MTRLIKVRFDFAINHESVVTIYRTDLPQVPSVNEIVNIKGYPYLIQDRSWAIDPDTEELYAFLVVVKYGNYDYDPTKPEEESDESNP